MIALTASQYGAIARLADAEAGLHMPEARRSFASSRLQRRLRLLGLTDFDDYLALLRAPPPAGRDERRRMISALTTNVTEMYREPHHFATLAADLADRRRTSPGQPRRHAIWSAGCASGEEPLSIAATCRAVLGTRWAASVRILATDVDATVVERARARSDASDLPTPVSALPAGVPEPRWDPSQEDALVADLQAGIDYMRHNVLDPLPTSCRFDAIFCRNVTIYFGPAAQRTAHERLRERLRPGGMLALGHSEHYLGKRSDLLPLGRTTYRRPLPCPGEAVATVPTGESAWP